MGAQPTWRLIIQASPCLCWAFSPRIDPDGSPWPLSRWTSSLRQHPSKCKPSVRAHAAGLCGKAGKFALDEASQSLPSLNYHWFYQESFPCDFGVHFFVFSLLVSEDGDKQRSPLLRVRIRLPHLRAHS